MEAWPFFTRKKSEKIDKWLKASTSGAESEELESLALTAVKDCLPVKL